MALAKEDRWEELAELVTAQVDRRGLDASRARPSRREALVKRATAYMSRGMVQKAIRATSQIDEDAHDPVDVRAAVESLFVLSPPAAEREAEGEVGAPYDRGVVSEVRRTLVERLRSGSHPKSWTEIVVGAVRQLGVGSAAGPCGLRRDVLLPLLDDRPTAEAFATLVNLALAGCLRDPYLTGSALELIPKASGGARPLGMGSILRRVCGKLAARAAVAEVRSFTEPRAQLALSEAGTIRLFRQVRDAADDGMFVVALDIHNAFNTISRERVMSTVARHAGPAREFASVLYDDATPFTARTQDRSREATDSVVGIDGSRHLLFDTNTGVIQGCPLAPLLFAAAMADAVDRARTPGVEYGAFQDDVYMVSRDVPSRLLSWL